MKASKKKNKDRRVPPEKSGLADKRRVATSLDLERVIWALGIGLGALGVAVAMANVGSVRPLGGAGSDWQWHLMRSSILLLLIAASYGAYLVLFERRIVNVRRRLLPHVIVALVPIVACKALPALLHRLPYFTESFLEFAVYVTPMVFCAMVFSIAHGGRTAVYLSALLTVAVGVICQEPGEAVPFALMLTLLGGSTVAALGTGRIRWRSKPLRIGLAAGAVQAVVAFAATAVERGAINPNIILITGANGVVCGGLVLVGLAFIERAFGVTTDLSLLELSDQNHKLLRRLALDAPGTYHHSQILGGLAETAGEAIGANSLLLRVGAYFHDVGKLNKPEYFAENQSSPGSLHDRLSPAMSTLIIAAHTKDGVEIARDYRLPEAVVSLIQQHHGTSLIEYFYRKAVEEDAGEAGVKEEFFRHPGPKPHTREAAVLLLADCAESASRTLSDPTPSRIERLVREIINRRLTDGQLSECNLTLDGVHRIEQALVKGLTHVFHGRVKYPSSSEEPGATEEAAGDVRNSQGAG